MARNRPNAAMTLDAPAHPARLFRAPAFRPGSACVARARQRGGQIKASPAYTTAIGEDCRFVAPSGDGDESTPKPVLKATVQTDFAVTLKFAMYNHDQIEIQSQRAGETEWTTIGFDTNSPYTDARAPLVAGQPENRRYRARYIKNDNPVGEWSDIIEVTAAA